MSQTDLFSAPRLEQLTLAGAEVSVWRRWLQPERAQALYDEMLASLQWRQPDIRIAGKQLRIPRLQAWHGDRSAHYTYSGQRFQPEPWTTALAYLRDQLQGERNARFNSVLVNFYRDGRDGVSWHSDNERELGDYPTIASVSLGATRKFSLRPVVRERGFGSSVSIELQAGDLLIMAGPTQKNWQHCIPKTKKPVGGRINLTYRYIAR